MKCVYAIILCSLLQQSLFLASESTFYKNLNKNVHTLYVKYFSGHDIQLTKNKKPLHCETSVEELQKILLLYAMNCGAGKDNETIRLLGKGRTLSVISDKDQNFAAVACCIKPGDRFFCKNKQTETESHLVYDKKINQWVLIQQLCNKKR